MSELKAYQYTDNNILGISLPDGAMHYISVQGKYDSYNVYGNVQVLVCNNINVTYTESSGKIKCYFKCSFVPTKLQYRIDSGSTLYDCTFSYSKKNDDSYGIYFEIDKPQFTKIKSIPITFILHFNENNNLENRYYGITTNSLLDNFTLYYKNIKSSNISFDVSGNSLTQVQINDNAHIIDDNIVYDINSSLFYFSKQTSLSDYNFLKNKVLCIFDKNNNIKHRFLIKKSYTEGNLIKFSIYNFDVNKLEKYSNLLGYSKTINNIVFFEYFPNIYYIDYPNYGDKVYEKLIYSDISGNISSFNDIYMNSEYYNIENEDPVYINFLDDLQNILIRKKVSWQV